MGRKKADTGTRTEVHDPVKWAQYMRDWRARKKRERLAEAEAELERARLAAGIADEES